MGIVLKHIVDNGVGVALEILGGNVLITLDSVYSYCLGSSAVFSGIMVCFGLQGVLVTLCPLINVKVDALVILVEIANADIPTI